MYEVITLGKGNHFEHKKVILASLNPILGGK